MPLRPNSRAALGALALLLAAGAAGGQTAADQTAAGGLSIEDPWARASLGIDRPGAAYFTLRNDGATDDALIAVETPAAHMAELHRTEVTDGVASMAAVPALPLPAGSETPLAPGGVHVMLMMLTAPLEEGGSIPLTLVFEQAGRIEVTVPVYGIGARGPAE